MFFGSNSPTSEVVIYKSSSDISMKDDAYQGYEERFLIDEMNLKKLMSQNMKIMPIL
jgi:aspartate/tyrosine/aromatic aminotransferase